MQLDLTAQLESRGIPHRQIGPCLLVNGDCLEVLPLLEAGSVDITVSSPPYNMIAKTAPSGLMKEASRKKNAGYLSHADNMTTEDYESWVREVFQMCVDVCAGVVWVNHKTKYENRQGRHPARIYPWPIFCEIIWNTGGSLTLNANRYAPSHETVIGFGTPNYWNRCNDMTLTVWRINPERSIDSHPCPFPLEIPERLIASSCPPGGVVVDPFGGSGTTGAACIRNGRRCIIIEVDAEYYGDSCKRIERAWLEKRSELPFEKPPVETQAELFEVAS